jgi:3',5'-cyclic AMP phosphodiesterase CpdA
MRRLRLAHFSDIHYTVSPFAHFPDGLRGKRLAGCTSYLLGGRRTRFQACAERISILLDDIDQAGVDHALCTGDITSVSLEAEFKGLAQVFGARLNAPERYTVIPGNHDRYIPEPPGERGFERFFGTLAARNYPFSKSLSGGARIVAIDVSRPTSLTDSSGLCGPEQRAALESLLVADTSSPTLVAMHYGLLRWRGNPDREHHGMRDATDVLKLLNDSPARIALVLHGHMHGAFTVSSGRHPIICAGSATDLLVDCGYCIYDIDLETLAVRIERRHWNRSRNRYEAVDATMLNEAVQQRRGATLDRRLLR